MDLLGNPLSIDRAAPICYFDGSPSGDIAQLGERLDGIEKVRGSSPLVSISLTAVTEICYGSFVFA